MALARQLQNRSSGQASHSCLLSIYQRWVEFLYRLMSSLTTMANIALAQVKELLFKWDSFSFRACIKKRVESL